MSANATPNAPIVPPQAEPQSAAPPPPPPPAAGVFLGTGRRKAAVARVRLVPGAGKITINGREVDKYFTESYGRTAVRGPLLAANAERHFDAQITVHGGGMTGQAGAIRMGVARALVAADSRFEPIMRKSGLLTRDSRVVERKKPGQRKARRRFQFSKR